MALPGRPRPWVQLSTTGKGQQGDFLRRRRWQHGSGLSAHTMKGLLCGCTQYHHCVLKGTSSAMLLGVLFLAVEPPIDFYVSC